LGLAIPDQIYPSGPSFNADPRKVEHWLDSLPKAHIGETSRLVYNAIVELNHLELSTQHRHEVLELFSQTIDYVVSSLKKYYVGQSFPLSQKKYKIAKLARELLTEYATGYKIVIETLLGQGLAGATDHNLLTASICRTLQYHRAILLNAYLIYSASPENLWAETHKLYRYSYTSDIHLTPVESTIFTEQQHTIDSLYKEILLLALVNPYQLAQEEIEKIAQTLPFWTPYCTLTNLEDPDHPPGLFAVNLELDEPPAYFAYCSTNPYDCLILDTTELAAQLRELLTITDSGGRPEHFAPALRAMSISTLKRVLMSWGLLSKRNFRRRGKSSEVLITLGLTATHRFVRQMQVAGGHGNGNDQYHPDYHSEPVIGADGSGLYPDIWDFDDEHDTRMGIASRTKNRSDASQTAQLLKDAQQFNITNESAGGYCLLWQQSEFDSLKVGDLVCIHHSRAVDGDYNICVIRWMKSINHVMVLGVEVLSPYAEAVGAKLADESNKASDYFGSLLLPQIHAVKRPVTLITPTLFRTGDVLRLKTHAGEQTIRLTQLQQTTKTFKQFQFVNVGAQTTTEDNSDFESIWASL
jgi:hypothetical protein